MLPLPQANIYTYFSLREKCWPRGGAGGAFGGGGGGGGLALRRVG